MNQTDNQVSNKQQPLIENSAAESLADLPLTAAQAEETKAGAGVVKQIGGTFTRTHQLPDRS